MSSQRLTNLKKLLQEQAACAVLVMQPENVYYLSGYTGGEGYLVVTEQENLLLTDFRYLEQAEQQAPLFKIIDIEGSFYKTLEKVLKGQKVVLFEDNYINVKQYTKLKEIPVEWKSIQGGIEKLRLVKSPEELDCLRYAAKIADEAFIHILGFIKPGVKEQEISAELDYFMKKKGSEGPSFDFIVASGTRGSMPHGVASDKLIAQGEMLTIDFGSIYKGYHSDITRTIAIGNPSQEMLNIYNIVQKAQYESLALVKAGVVCKDIDAVARDIITKEGYGDNFRHGLGHGLGLEIHEEPRFNTTDNTILKTNMVLTVEPGIYVSGLGGVRIEDSVIVKDDTYEVITQVSKDLIIL